MEKEFKVNIFDLEYSKLEKAEMITHLNKLLSSYQVFHHKTRNFYWNIVGQDNYDLRKSFFDLSKKSLRNMDRLSGRIRLFNHQTTEKWKDILLSSEIAESGSGLTGFEMVKVIIADILTLLSIQSDCIEKATELGDHGTELTVKGMTCSLEDEYLLLVSWLK